MKQNDYAQQGGRNNNGYGGSRNNDYNRQNGGNRNNRNTLPPKLEAEAVPEDYVEQAENVIRVIAGKDKRNQITTSKLRNLYSLVTDVMNIEQLRTEAMILDTSSAALQRARIRFAYESGRDPATKEFVNESKLISYLKWVGTDRSRMLRFAHYMEALVAYHRFYHDAGNEK